MCKVEVRNSDLGAYEWCILEFQGEIINAETNRDLGNIEVTENTAHMDLGQHTLEGDIVKLKAPFMVLEKKKATEEDQASMSIGGVVYKKIIFKQRPRPKRIVKS